MIAVSWVRAHLAPRRTGFHLRRVDPVSDLRRKGFNLSRCGRRIPDGNSSRYVEEIEVVDSALCEKCLASFRRSTTRAPGGGGGPRYLTP